MTMLPSLRVIAREKKALLTRCPLPVTSPPPFSLSLSLSHTHTHIIQKFELLARKKNVKPNQTNKDLWLHVVVPRGENQAKVMKQEWAGVLNDAKEKLGKQIVESSEQATVEMSALKKQVDKIETEMLEMKTDMKEALAAILKAIDNGQGKVDGEDETPMGFTVLTN